MAGAECSCVLRGDYWRIQLRSPARVGGLPDASLAADFLRRGGLLGSARTDPLEQDETMARGSGRESSGKPFGPGSTPSCREGPRASSSASPDNGLFRCGVIARGDGVNWLFPE